MRPGNNAVRQKIVGIGQDLAGDRFCAGFWTPASGGAPLAPAAGVQKAPRHEVAGSLGRVGSQRYGDLIFASIMTVGAKLFGRRHQEVRLLLRRPASKKRQGTKSREVWAGWAASAMGI